MKFHFSCISKRPEIFMDMCRHSFSGSVYIIFYHPKWNFISVKMTDTKFIPALSFKCTFALTQHPTGLHLFIPFQINYVHMKISCHFKILFRSKWPIWNPYRFEFHFDSVPVNTSKELTEHLRFSTEIKSHTGLSSFRLSCERTLKFVVKVWNGSMKKCNYGKTVIFFEKLQNPNYRTRHPQSTFPWLHD